MAYRKRKIPAINSSASADIAFLLLVFFLVASSFDSKTGVYRKLNVPVAENVLKQRMDIQERNILSFTIDADNRILYNNEEIRLKDIRDLSKTFISNPNDQDFLPEKQTIDIPEIGAYSVATKHVISLETDREAAYQTYISVLSELTAAYNELRNEAALSIFHTPFLRLTAEQKDAIRAIYPAHISETEINNEKTGGRHE